MSTAFQLPEWFPVAEPPPSQPVDDHRIEALVNRFIAGKQEALFTAPDALYRLSGGDAVDEAPAAVQRLQALKASVLEQARDDGERAALGPRLDLHIDDANDGIARHVGEQRRVYQRQILSDRQSLIQRAAARVKRNCPNADIVTQIRVYVDGGPSYMVADIIFRASGTSTIVITEVKTGSGILTDNQMKALAEAARTGGIYITNAHALEKYGIEPNKTFGEQGIIPEVYVVGGHSAKIEKQMRDQGLDVRRAGAGRLRIGGPPN